MATSESSTPNMMSNNLFINGHHKLCQQHLQAFIFKILRA